jgi:hypothetical protein
VTPATLLRELRAAGVVLRVRGGRLEAKHLPPHLSALTKAHAAELRRLLAEPVDAWRLDLATWPSWRRDVFEERAAIREVDGQQPRDLAERCAYLEAVEAPEEPSPLLAPPSTTPPVNDAAEAPAPEAPDLEELAAGAPTLALLLEAFPGARVEVRPRRSPAVDLEEPESADPAEQEAPSGFRYRYRPPPEHCALPLFRWSVPLPPARRADAQAYRKPSPPAPAPAGPPAPLRSLCDPHEPPERRAARHGYRIDASGAWVEEGKASVAPYLPRFAVGHRPTPEEEREASALLDRIRTYCAQVIDRTRAVDGPEETRSLTVNESRGGLPGLGPGVRGPVARPPGASARAVGVVLPRS